MFARDKQYDIYTEEVDSSDTYFHPLEKGCHIREKTVVSGQFLECEVYPVFPPSRSRELKKQVSSEKQARQNKKNQIKTLTRILNENFKYGDSWLSLTYDKNNLPESYKEYRKQIVNFIRRITRFMKKQGLEHKYVYVVESESRGKRKHAHLVTNCKDISFLCLQWGFGTCNYRPLRKITERFGFEGLAEYLAGHCVPGNKYGCSKNLKKTWVRPYVKVSDKRGYSKKRLNKLVADETFRKEYFEKRYPGYRLFGVEIFDSEFVDGVYIYAKMEKAI